jgi:uncharacterized protein (TIGR02284 family)
MANGIATLQTLTDTAIDSVLGYEKAAESATSENLSQTLRQCASDRREVVASLNNEIARLGGDTREDGSFSGSVHRVWTDITTAFGDKDESAIERVEEGEDYIKGKFETALEDNELEPQSRHVVQQCYSQVSEGERMADRLKAHID